MKKTASMCRFIWSKALAGHQALAKVAFFRLLQRKLPANTFAARRSSIADNSCPILNNPIKFSHAF